MAKLPAAIACALAVATFHKIDVLLTWNCKHLANPNKIDRLNLINFEIGMRTPLLMTPLNYLDGDDDE